MNKLTGWVAALGVTCALVVPAPAAAQSAVELSSSTPEQKRQLELVKPGPALRDKSRVPEAEFYGEDQRVPYDPAFVEPFVGTTKGGTKYGASVWTAPQTPVGSWASQVYQQNSGWLGFGITFIWDSAPPAAARPAATPAR
jgi:hypothetical protein